MSSRNKTVTARFDTTVVQSGNSISLKTFHDTQSSIDNKEIFIADVKYRVKAKQIKSVEVHEKLMEIRTDKLKIVLQDATDDREWEDFSDKIQALYKKHQSKEKFGKFLASSSNKALGKTRHNHPPISSAKRVRKAFGKHGGTPDLFSPKRETFWDDDDDDDEAPHTSNVQKEAPSLAEAENDIDMGQDDDNNAKSSPVPPLEEDRDSEESEKERSHLNARKGRLKQRKRNLKKAGRPVGGRGDDDEESDDDDMFMHPDTTKTDGFTTPAAQRVVSPSAGTTATSDARCVDPATATTNTTTTTTTTDASKAVKTPPRKQQTVSSFFQQKSTAKQPFQSPIPVSKTSPRSRASSVASARIVRSAKKELQQSNTWLRKSPMTSKAEQHRRNILLGESAGSIRRLEEDDPIEEFDSPSKKRQPKRIRLTPRPNVSVRTNLAMSLAEEAPLVPVKKSWDKPVITPAAPAPICKYPLRGLRNLGNTCYVNASLQMLCTVTDFISSLGGGKGRRLTKSLVQVAKELADKTVPTNIPVDPWLLKEAVDEKTDKFIGFEQRDAHEFLSDLVDHVHEELVAEHGETGAGVGNSTTATKEKSPLPTDDFRLTVQVCLTCNSCAYTRTKEEIYRHLSIDIVENKTDSGQEEAGPSKASIEKSLSRFFQPEVREIKCEKCEEGTHASQSLRVLSSPKNLLLHLKRFIVVEKRRESPINGDENRSPNSPSTAPPVQYIFKKNKDPVALSESLSLDPFLNKNHLSGSIGPSSLSSYHLKSIVHHIGSRASSGHYTADAIRLMPKAQAAASSDADGPPADVSIDNGDEELVPQWVTFDDVASGKNTWETIASSRYKQTTAYMLLYTKD